MESQREQDSRNLHRRRRRKDVIGRRPSMNWLTILIVTVPLILAQTVVGQHRGNLPPRFRTDTNDAGDQHSEIVVRVKEGASSLNREIYHLAGEDPDGDSLQFGVLGPIGRDILRIESISKTEAK